MSDVFIRVCISEINFIHFLSIAHVQITFRCISILFILFIFYRCWFIISNLAPQRRADLDCKHSWKYFDLEGNFRLDASLTIASVQNKLHSYRFFVLIMQRGDNCNNITERIWDWEVQPSIIYHKHELQRGKNPRILYNYR